MADGKPKRRGGGIGSFLIAGVCLAILPGLFAVREFVARPYRVPSASMAPTATPGEYLLAFNLKRENGLPVVRVGDVVIHKGVDDNRDFIRRVLAMPGHRIAFQGGVPVVDGIPLAQEDAGEGAPDLGVEHRLARETVGVRTYLVQYRTEELRVPRDMSEVVVPEGHVFLVGDNRDNSNDSRFLGSVPIELVQRRAAFIISSPDSSRVGRRIE